MIIIIYRSRELFNKNKRINIVLKNDGDNVELKNGTMAPKAAITTTMVSLQSLLKKDPLGLVLCDLVDLCNNSANKPFDPEALERTGLVCRGEIHDITRNIILSATQWEGIYLHLVDPIK
jgi:hypothetical protein